MPAIYVDAVERGEIDGDVSSFDPTPSIGENLSELQALITQASLPEATLLWDEIADIERKINRSGLNEKYRQLALKRLLKKGLSRYSLVLREASAAELRKVSR